MDWQHFLRIVDHHRVWGLAFDGLRRAQLRPPAEVTCTLGAQARAVARTNLAQCAEAIDLQHLFHRAGVRVVLLKGIALAKLAYGDLSLKYGKDLDLLVSPEDARLAIAGLERAGYVLCEPRPALSRAQRELWLRHSKEFGFRHHKTGSNVELHWRLVDNPHQLSGVDPFSDLELLRLTDESSICTLGRNLLPVYLSVHGATHAWFRLKWLADFGALLSREGSNVEQLHDLAKNWGAARSFGQALLLSERLLGMKIPSSLSVELRASQALAFLEASALSAMLRGNATTGPNEGLGSVRFVLSGIRLGDNSRARWSALRAYLFGPHDMVRLCLPACLHFAYPLVRVPSLLCRRVAWPMLSKLTGRARRKPVSGAK